MNHAQKRVALIELHSRKLLHARLQGCVEMQAWLQPTRMNIHMIQVQINEKRFYEKRSAQSSLSKQRTRQPV